MSRVNTLNEFRTCEMCGKKFEATVYNKKFCCSTCRDEAKKEKAKRLPKKVVKGVCLVCGKEFIKTANNQKYCSKECSLKREKEALKKYYRAHNYSGISKGDIKECPVCGKEFEVKSGHQKYCSVKCKLKGYRMLRPTKGDIKECPVCGKEFIINNGNQKYCSIECRLKRHGRQYSSSGFTKGDIKTCPVCGKKFVLKYGNQKYCSAKCVKVIDKERKTSQHEDVRKCPVCGKEFQAKHGLQKYCSAKCVRIAKRGYVKNSRKRKLEKVKLSKDETWVTLGAIETATNSAYSKRKTSIGSIKVCPVCGKEFILTRGNQKYCSSDCLVKGIKLLEKLEPFKSGIKKCAICGKEFVSKSRNHLYCSYACKYKARTQKLEELKEVSALSANDTIKTQEYKECAFCGKEFIPKTEAQKYCSNRCVLKLNKILSRERKKIEKEYTEKNEKPMSLLSRIKNFFSKE